MFHTLQTSSAFSQNWFKGTSTTGKPYLIIVLGVTTWLYCRCSLKPIHWQTMTNPFTTAAVLRKAPALVSDLEGHHWIFTSCGGSIRCLDRWGNASKGTNEWLISTLNIQWGISVKMFCFVMKSLLYGSFRLLGGRGQWEKDGSKTISVVCCLIIPTY